MKGILSRNSFALAALGVAMLATPTFAQEAASAPKAVIEETTFNAGDVAKGDIVDHDFVVKNTGTADLLILNVKPACGCTTPGFDKVVPAGGTGKISLKVDTARFKGPISKSASVQTNDPEQPNMRLVVNATVKTFIDILPRDFVTFRQYRGEETKEEITIHSNEQGAFEIKDVQLVGENIKHELKKDGEDYKLTVWIDPQAPVGNLAGSVKLMTSSKKEPEVTVNVRGTILGQISINPSTLYFRVDNTTSEVAALTDSLNVRERGELSAPVVAQLAKGQPLKVVEKGADWTKVALPAGGEGYVYNKLVGAVGNANAAQSKVLNITHRKQSAFKLSGSEIQGSNLSDTNLSIETEEVREGQSYRVTVTYAGGLAAGNYTGSLVIKTSDTEEPEVKIPVYIVVT